MCHVADFKIMYIVSDTVFTASVVKYIFFTTEYNVYCKFYLYLCVCT